MGGGTIRTASKLASIAASTGCIRGLSTGHFPFSSARNALSAFPPAAPVDLKIVAERLEAGVQKPCPGIDDWVFAGGEEDNLLSAGESLPRVVFGGMPSLQEAKEATSELTVAFEKTYLSSPSSVGCETSLGLDNDSRMSLSNKQDMGMEACVSSDVVIGAFRFLRENPMAQNVVASIACDPNVWNAVLQNNDLRDFLQSQTACSFPETNLDVKSVDGSDVPNDSSKQAADEPTETGSGLGDVFRKIKSTVVDMMNNLFHYMRSFFVNADGTAKVSGERVMMGLGILVIFVILLKRR